MLTNIITRFYTGSTNISTASKESLTEMMTDATFLIPSIQTSKAMASSGSDIFSYILDFEGSYSNSNKLGRFGLDGMFGVIHGDDIRYLFETSKDDELLTDDEKKTSQLMLSLWTDFAKHFEMTSWPKYSGNNRPVLFIGPNLETRENIFEEKILFWEKLIWKPLAQQPINDNRLKTDDIHDKRTRFMILKPLPYSWPPIFPAFYGNPFTSLHHHISHRTHYGG